MAFVLIKQEVDWEADYSDDYSPGYILLKKEGGRPPTLVRRQPLRELPGRALVPPGAVRALINRYTQERPPTTQSTSGAAAAVFQGDPDTQEAPQALSPSQPRTREVTSGSAGQSPGAEQQSLVRPAAESPSTLHQTASPQSAATIQSTSPVLSAVLVQSTVTTLSKETVQSTLTVKSTAAASERLPPVLYGLPRTPLQDTQPSPVPPRPPQSSPSQSFTDVLPVARPIAVPSTQSARPTGPPAAPPTQPQPPTVLEQLGVATSLTPSVQSAPSPTVLTEPAGPPEKQAPLVTDHVQLSPTVPRLKSPAVPERMSDEAPPQLSDPAVTTPSCPFQMSKTQFLAQLSVVPQVRALPWLEEEEEEKGGEEDEGQEDEGGLSSLPATSTEAVTTRSVATETTPASEKKEIVVQVGGGRKSSQREALLSGLRLRLRPCPQNNTPSPVVAKKPREEGTAPRYHTSSNRLRRKVSPKTSVQTAVVS
ncbi:proteoglycan 4-like [Oncorhynchus mykiss]|uniref:proteoglycan 4-like n=1 Tax=Oncorhynchus mykiss TaxID=8022 RepID=UPI001878BEF3|nr:proteoglycan 4-like [Oncorhynchus mykiss]XP_036789970.1 proteoglycan 4-like [Oncorhynchus mykiss]